MFLSLLEGRDETDNDRADKANRDYKNDRDDKDDRDNKNECRDDER